jgi:hypothetical protein
MVHSAASNPAKLSVISSSPRAHKSGREASQANVVSLATLWARNYFVSVTSRDDASQVRQAKTINEATSQAGRFRTAECLKANLSLSSAQAWSQTENLLSEENRRHGIDPSLINPWEIAADSHRLFERTLAAYSDRVTPRRLSVLIGHEFGQVRAKYTSEDPRAIGFVSMQFHYTGQLLLERLSLPERVLLEPYFKVMDDHLYMPLRAAYEAAANHDYHSPALQAVHQLLPLSTKIAYAVCKQISRQHPGYQSHSGLLSSATVRTSSIRDVEMFQVYLCLCALENSIQSVQNELFPLCVMLYPRLNVRWQLVQDMLQQIGWEMHARLSPEHTATFLPHLLTLMSIFSSDVFDQC